MKILNKFKHLFGKKYGNAALNRECSELEVDKWLISEFIIEKLTPVVGIRPFPLDELMLMTVAVVKFQPTHIFEWGTNIGKSARIFYETSKAFSMDIEVHSIDLPDYIDHVEHPGAQRGMLVKGLDNVFLHQGDGLDMSIQLYEEYKIKGCKPLFFLDGDHRYETVKRELSQILVHIPEGVVLIHDTFYQSPESRYNTGPHQAVEEVLKTMNGGFDKFSAELGLPGMTLVYKGSWP